MTSTFASSSTPLTHRWLLIGIQTFSQILKEGYDYADKSGMAEDLADQGKYYF